MSQGKTIVITGAASGIGKSLAKAFAQQGAKLALSDINAESLKNTVDELSNYTKDIISQTVDVSKSDQMTDFADQCFSTYGSVDILINNAGIFHKMQKMGNITLADWHETLDVNLYGVIHGIHAFLQKMITSKTEGHIVNIASMAGLVPAPAMGPYTASKFAVVGISESLASECQDTPISVSVVCPGPVKTNIANKASTIVKELVNQGKNSDDIAEVILKGIREKKFYILTHSDYKKDIEARFSNLVSSF